MPLNIELVAAGVLIFAAVFFHRFASKIGVPVLLAFIGLGLLVGEDGLLQIPFENYALAGDLCTVALVFIMFSGGFGTSWPSARPIVVRAGLLASLGVAVTAGITAAGCHYLLQIPWLEALLIGAVLSSTDAASVFSILRSRRLGLKENTDSLLEVESGSNDPMAYMLTVVVLGVMAGTQGLEAGAGQEVSRVAAKLVTDPELLASQLSFPVISSAGQVVLLLALQFIVGALGGVAVGLAGRAALRRFGAGADGMDMVLLSGLAVFAYAAPGLLGGNGYLATYLAGIILGNSRLPGQKELVSFFDGITALCQMALFFVLGLLATPSRIPADFGTALVVAAVLTLVARPLATALTLLPFGSSWRQIALVSFSGLRGAASIVFAIMATVAPPVLHGDIFHVVFSVVLLSILLQGTLLPAAAKLLRMSDNSVDVLRTFSDYTADSRLQLREVCLREGAPGVGQSVAEYSPDPGQLIVMILRGKKTVIPHGKTRLKVGDRLVITELPEE